MRIYSTSISFFQKEIITVHGSWISKLQVSAASQSQRTIQEFEAWALRRLALPASSLQKAFNDLDLCQQQQLYEEQLSLLVQPLGFGQK